MNDQLLAIVAVGLVGLTLVMLVMAITRLRRETTVSVRALTLGAGVPLVATAAYLVVGGPPFNPLFVLVAGGLGAAVGAALAALTRMERAGVAVTVRQSGWALAAWSVVYVVAALAALQRSSDLQAIAALALALAAGLAAGTQFVLSLRSRPAARSSAGPTMYGWQGSPAVAAPPARSMAPPMGTLMAPLPQEPIHYTHGGARFLFGYTATYNAIFERTTPTTPIAKFPRSADGRAAAWSQFFGWEPRPQPVAPYPSLSLQPVADGPVAFTHVGSRFALGHTPELYGVWDRWTPGPPMVKYAPGAQGAQQAWEAFIVWEPSAVAL